MSSFGIKSDDLRAALGALLPFVPKPTAVGDDEPETAGIIIGHLLKNRLLLTVKGPAAIGVVALTLDDWDGELTDFAIHKADAGMLVQTFRRMDRTLQFDVTHSDYTVPPATKNDSPKQMRETTISVQEQGALFGGAHIVFTGTDGRATDVKTIWSDIAISCNTKAATPSTRIPGRVLALTSKAAAAWHSTPVFALDANRDVLATIGYAAVFLFWHESVDDEGPRDTPGAGPRIQWPTVMQDAVSLAHEHRIYIDEEMDA